MKKLQTSSETHSSDTIGENHGDTDSHMFPCTHVVASPHGSIPLGTSVEGTGKDKRALVRGRPLFNGLRRDIHEEHAIDVVNIPVFPTAVVNRILLHRDFWSVEDSWLSES